jgi:hypothetical protein
MSSLLGLTFMLFLPSCHAFLSCPGSTILHKQSLLLSHSRSRHLSCLTSHDAFDSLSKKAHWRSGLKLSMKSEINQQADSSASVESSGPLRKYGLLGFWISFIAYAFILAPNGDPEVQQNMLKALIAPPPWDGANPIFASLFILLGVWPAVYAGLLVPLKPTAQTLPAWPFITASFGLGAFGLTPYLALTSYAPGPTESESGAARFFGSTAMGVFLLVNTIALMLFALGVFAPNDLNGGSDYPVDVIFYTYFKNFGELFSTYKLVHLPSCDFVALWALSSKPLLEDMRRRGWFRGGAFDVALFASFMLAPLVGACAWLAVRPPLPSATAAAPAVPWSESDDAGGAP